MTINVQVVKVESCETRQGLYEAELLSQRREAIEAYLTITN